MPLLAFGVNHETAPVGIRERVSFAPDHLPEALHELVACDGVNEAAILSTCNRTDLYCGLVEDEAGQAVDWFSQYHGLRTREIQPYIYLHRAESAVRHIMRVASGLDSMVLGEPQILGQVKDAYNTALKSGTIGTNLGKLFQHTFSVAKHVRTDTAIGSSAVSVAFAAVSLAKQIFGELNEYTALLIGAGETIELAARHLKASGLGRLVVANRTVENAHRLAMDFGGYAIALNEIGVHLAEADIIVSSTASPEPILSVQDVKAAVHTRRRRPVFMVDIAVPRDIDPKVAELADVYLYTVDDLKDVIEDNLRSRREAAHQAEEIIDTHVDHFMGWLGSQDAVSTIQAFRASSETLRDEVLEKARRMLASGKAPDEALEFLANTLTKKMLHGPSSRLRQAGAEGRSDLIDAAQALFDSADPKGTK